ncbi:MAG TPA: GNAT family N-acetyltransferase [Geminicoccaceae bacterium]|nr:GNAT family N-acetyltransferase [Geminicoccaceae bacterium]
MTTHTVNLLTPQQAQARRGALVDLLVDTVEGGASVNFVWPMTRAKAETWWEGALASHARGERLIFAAEAHGRLDGTVQLILAPQENQSFRADLAKLLVHRRARRQGLGAALMRAAEDEARQIGRTLLNLDTVAGSAADRLYTRLGWTKYGEIPAYSTSADNRTREAVSFFYKAL